MVDEAGSSGLRRGTVTVDGMRIGWTATSGAGHEALLVHGNSSSRRTFEPVMERLADRGLWAIDLPGHGESDHAPASDAGRYSLAWFARAVAGAARALGLERAVLVGHSLGGHILLEGVADGALAAARGLFLHGTPPIASAADMERAFRPNPNAAMMFAPEPDDDAVAAVARDWYGAQMAPPAHATAAFRATDPAVRARLGESIAGGELADEIAAVRELACPLAIVHAEADRFVADGWLHALDAPTLWRGAVQTVSASHFPQEEVPDTYARLLAAFLEDVERS